MIWTKFKASWIWRHKTRVTGLAWAAFSYAQANLASIGAALPAKLFAEISVGIGIVVFALGLANSVLGQGSVDPETPAGS